MKNWQLRNKIIAAFIIGIIVPLTIVGFLSYFITSRIVKRNINDYILQTLEQANSNLNTIVDDVNDLSLFIIGDEDVRNLLKYRVDNYDSDYILKNRVGNYFLNLCNSKIYIRSISLIDNDGKEYQYGSQVANTDINFIKENTAEGGSYTISPNLVQNYLDVGEKTVIAFSRQINDVKTFKKIGLVSIDIDQNYINGIYKYLKLRNTGEMVLINKDGSVISSNSIVKVPKDTFSKENMKILSQNTAGYFRKEIEGKDMLIAYNTSKKTGWKIVQIVPYDDVMRDGIYLRNFTIIIAIIFSIVAVIVSIRFASYITGSLYKLIDAMAEVEKGRFDLKVEVEFDDEVGKLGKGFNHMIKKIEQLIDEVYKTEIKEKEAQISALQSKINPHFLYNTLDTIHWIGRMEEAPRTSEMIQALSDLFRLSLGKDEYIIKIEDEKEYLKNYVLIQKIRYEDQVDIEMDIDLDIYQYSIVKMILQPIVENALIHGMEDMEKKGRIKISGYKEGENIIFCITDNGRGMDESVVNQILDEENKKTKGLGIKNVDDRIKLYFGKKYGLDIKSQINKGTVVQITIPAIKINDMGGNKNESVNCG